MKEYKKIFKILRCVNCGGYLNVNTPRKFIQYPSVNAELNCSSCKMAYPVVGGVPIIFNDAERMSILIDSTLYEDHLKKAEETMQKASQVAGSELNQFKEEQLSDALSWEILFWERWKQSDEGFLEFNRTKIEEYLKDDTEGGGRLEFFNKVISLNGSNKRILNIGAGRDFLMERFLDQGCEVIEQDIVLEPLLLLKKRGASFCICCDARALPFDDNTFDITTSFSVLHHIWPIEESIKELLRVTRGNIHFNEPNYFALTRLGLLLPGPFKHRLKRFYSGDSSHSPYEDCINPYSFKQIVSSLGGKCIDLSFKKDSWISKQSAGVKKTLRMVNLILVNFIPLASAHFDAVIKKYE